MENSSTSEMRPALLLLLAPLALSGQTVHTLKATPTTVAYGYYWSEAKPALRVKSGDIVDREKMTAEVAPGITVPLRPFFGSMGVAPAASLGRVSSNPPSKHAGNLDNKELVAGTTLYIPVFVKGALLEVGDGHAAQGDGEVDQTAIETNLRGRLQLVVRKDMKLEWPRGETPTHWIAMGTDTSLVVATKTAIREMVKPL